MTMPMTNNAALDGGRETVVQFDHLQHVYPGGVEALKDINLPEPQLSDLLRLRAG